MHLYPPFLPNNRRAWGPELSHTCTVHISSSSLCSFSGSYTEVKYLIIQPTHTHTKACLLDLPKPPLPLLIHIKHISTISTREDLPYSPPDAHFSKFRESKASRPKNCIIQPPRPPPLPLTPLQLGTNPTISLPSQRNPTATTYLPLRTDFKSSQTSFNLPPHPPGVLSSRFQTTAVTTSHVQKV